MLELSAFKAMLQLLVAFLVLTQDSCTSITAAKTARWSSIPRNSTVLDTKSTAGFGARSVTHCTVECSVDADCHDFCYDVSANRCYVSGVSTSQDPVPEIEALRCYYEEPCPVLKGYRRFGGRCIKAFQYNLTYTAARDTCVSDGGHLYHYKSLAMDKQPLQDLVAVDGFNDTIWQCWVGADDLEQEGTVVWSDGSILPPTSEVWATGEPNGNTHGIDEDCLILWGDQYRLNDLDCSVENWFVCQVDV